MCLINCCVLKVRYLGAIGGKDVAETTCRIICCLMMNAVANQMNFAGRGRKTGIADYNVLAVVIGRWNYFILHVRCHFSLTYINCMQSLEIYIFSLSELGN